MMDATKLALIVGVFVFAMMIPACEQSPNFRVDPSGRAPEARARTEVAEPWVNAPIVSLVDPGLEAAVRSATGVLTRDITTVDLETMTFLDASSRGITDLEGIQYCAGLEWLELGNNELTDVSQIADLPQLRSLNLRDNQISDIGALSELPHLCKGFTNLLKGLFFGNTFHNRIRENTDADGAQILSQKRVFFCPLNMLF